MSSTQHQLIEQCATRLRGIVEALDNIHDTIPHRWSTDLDDVHSSAESLLAMIKGQAPTQAAQGLAGAALAQPSPAQAEQAEAEGPEMSPERAAYFMRRFKSEEKLLGPNEQAAVDYVLSLLAQHDRIVGALRAKADQLREALEWRKENQAGQRELLRSVKAERDAALARVAELEKQEPVATVAKVPGEDWNSLDFHRDLQHMQPGTKLYAAPVARAQHSVPEEFIGRLSEFLAQRGATGKALLRELRAMLAAEPGTEVPQAWLDVQAERRRQIEAKGWTPEHDDLYCSAELPRAAAAYILNGANDEAPAIWPFVAKWWKPRDARSNYVRAGALILAEIERLDRAAASQGGPSDA
ncbi:TPA: hypothetical protein ACPIBI_004826 [Pseudomonas aeruginosa]|uniref:hypothetical protein n=1 Tax=Pseudomonas aeruginosa TaxID=287 RepID=UPI001A1C60CA|nr:hypothetical protein [Pseudomonas aeruginosa]MBG6407561.1 hypothetical protein [Pseudomonas aeruginosa]MBX6203554.1 hypothetical protein [Pseudomonas aeruginosa]